MRPAQDKDILAIIDQLVLDGKLLAENRDKAKAEYVTSGTSILEWLKQHEMVSEIDLAQARAKYFNIPFVNLKEKLHPLWLWVMSTKVWQTNCKLFQSILTTLPVF